MGELKNCPECGNLFVQVLRDVCDDCFKKEEEMFDKVYRYIRKSENRKATLYQVHQATEVPEDKITKFIRQGRIRVVGFPNLFYECETCGSPIQEGRLCFNCKKEITKGLEWMKTEEERKREEQLGQSYHIDRRR